MCPHDSYTAWCRMPTSCLLGSLARQSSQSAEEGPAPCRHLCLPSQPAHLLNTCGDIIYSPSSDAFLSLDTTRVVSCTCIHFFRASRGISKFYSFVHRNYQPFVASQLPLLTEKCQHRHDGKLSGCLVDGPPARRLRAQQHAACTTSLLHARSCPRVRRWTTICRAAPALFERAHGEGPEENQVHRADGECDSLFHRSLQASSGTKMGNATFKSAITSLHQWTGRPRET